MMQTPLLPTNYATIIKQGDTIKRGGGRGGGEQDIAQTSADTKQSDII